MCASENKVLSNFRPSRIARLTLWGLEERFHCSVIGTCLSLKELFKMGTKFNIKKQILDDSFDLHGAFVTISASCTAESKVINKYLNKKFRTAIVEFGQANNNEELLVLWQKALLKGDVPGAFWALVTSPKSSAELLYLVLGKVHMLSHLSGEMVRVDMLKLARLQRAVPSLEQKIKSQEYKTRQAITKKNEVIEALNEALIKAKETEQELQKAQIRIEKFELGSDIKNVHNCNTQLAKQLQDYHARFEMVEREVGEWKRLAETFSDHKQDLEERINKMMTEQKTVENMLESFISPCQLGEKKDLDLCNRCILFVGGRTRQAAHFRALVERLNGRFLHHDGGLEESSQRLSAMVAKSDAVLCPLDCVSHDAMNRIKKDCKHQGKPLQFLRQSGLATFSHGLERLITEH